MDHALLDPLDRGRGRDDLDRRGVLEQLGRERGDVLGQGGREEQALALLRHMAHHPPDGVDEADVEHAVDLVQDHHLDPVEPDRALTQMVDQPARRRHQDVDAARHDPLLAAHVDATEDDGGGQPQVACRRSGSCPRSGWPARGWAPAPGPGSNAAGAGGARPPADAGSAARRPPSCRCRSGRCPGGRGRRGHGGSPAPGWAWARCSSRPRAHRAAGSRGRDRKTGSREVLSLGSEGRRARTFVPPGAIIAWVGT